MESVLYLGLALVLSYLAGSIPFSIIVGRLFFGSDPRNHGSGNAGGTNTFRIYGPLAGTAVVIGDIGKGVAATLLVSQIAAGYPGIEEARVLCGSAAVIGHIWTVFAGFRGGKGVATAAGMVAALYPVAFALAALIFFLVITVTGRVSPGSLAVALTFPLNTGILSRLGIAPASDFLMTMSVILGGLIIFTHRENLGRLARGEEKKFERLMIFHKLFGKAKGNELRP